ncbi:metal-sulfur cluster assembly factor [Segeticoccus rhizosphaerae]|jgi:metal-sulfur cluster biosynthetic enzyme|uniref:metal-sulfur cluster assembly factor n=1 Tax=Segeticoccus rhizosphaerae TaxID=1104777 RepID=UPI001EE499FC|nr:MULTISPECIES: metal-sulfur cluster assembly factor [Intrasporangiaceae]
MAFWTRERGGSPIPPSPDLPAGDGSNGATPLSVSGWLQDKPDVQMLQDLLHGVIDPEIGVNIVDLGLVYGIRVSSDGVALVRMTLTTPGCPLSAYMDDAVRGALWGAPGVSDVDLQIIWEPPWSTDMMSHRAKQELGWER